MYRLLLSGVAVAMLLLCIPMTWAVEVIHQEKSLYRNIVVKESGDRRCLVFAVKRGDRNQTCMDVSDPNRVVFPYARMTFAGLLLNNNPGSVLVVGLGGGTIPTVLNQLYPEATIDVVEIDDAVKRVAVSYFDFRESEQMKVYVIDARVFVKRALVRKQQYDMVILDAFTGDYIPEHLLTQEFLQEVNRLLTPEGVLVANTFATSKLYDHESVTYQSVFGQFYNFKMKGLTGNRVIIANNKPPLPLKLLQDRANQLTGRFTRYGVNIEDYPKFLSTSADWDQKAKLLTDQFSPANLLRGDFFK